MTNQKKECEKQTTQRICHLFYENKKILSHEKQSDGKSLLAF